MGGSGTLEEALVRLLLRRLVLPLAVLCLVSGCGLAHMEQLSFRVDDRLEFLAPQDRAEVKQPVTVSWRMSDFRVAAPGSEPPSEDAGYFALFVDRTPIKPGASMDDVAGDDPVCKQDPKCPDAAYLRDHSVFPTTSTSVKIPLIPDLVGNKEDVQRHTLTVVLMDTSGHRLGESAWQLDLRIPRVGTS